MLYKDYCLRGINLSQSDVFQLLKDKILSGDYRYFSAEQISKLLKEKGNSINRNSLNNNLMKLRVFGFLDIKVEASQKNKVKRIYTVYRLNKNTLST
jgi:hypothetical protein